MKIVDPNQYKIDHKTLKPCDHYVIQGKTYHTRDQAMTAFNISKDVLKMRCRSHAYPNWQRFDRHTRTVKVKTNSKLSRQQFVIYVDGKEMSAKELIKKYKICDSTIRGRCLSRGYPGWVMKDRFTLKTVKKPTYGRVQRRWFKKLMAEHQMFDSVATAARTLNIRHDTIRARCKKNLKGYKIYE